MAMSKSQIVGTLEQIALLMELAGENPFKSRAFTNGARTLEQQTEDPAALVASGRLLDIKGIGKGLADAITEMVQTGRSAVYDALQTEIPAGLVEMLGIPGLGPKKIRAVYDDLGIATVGELEYACNENRLVSLKGFGAKTQEKILKGIDLFKRSRGRHLYAEVIGTAETLLDQVRRLPGVDRAELAGSIRRRAETIKDVDILVTTAAPESVMSGFVALPDIESVTVQGPTKTSVRLADGLAVDLRSVSAEQFPYAWQYFTGSQAHNTALRGRAKDRGWKLNEYGLYDGERLIPCADEAAIYEALGLQFIPPELREDWGELILAEQGPLPDLVTLQDLQGTFHAHTVASDGSATLGEMAEGARKLGLQYLGISDHSQSAVYAQGLKTDTLLEQHAAIDALNEAGQSVRVLKGIESDILADGNLDYDDTVLARFDFVIASVHSRFNMDGEAMTRRIVAAIRHPRTTMLGHMTGRLLLARDPYDLDIETILRTAADCGVIIELNANPHRLDIDWRWLRRARELGVLISINPDAHSVGGLADTAYGVNIARKGGLTAADVFNTRPLAAILAHLAARRARAEAMVAG
jgi:DNA polymerase (family 10)